MDKYKNFAIPVIIFFFALSLRLIYIFFFVGFETPPVSDGKYFDQVAVNLAEGNGFSLQPGIPTTRKPPVFTVFLAIIYKIFGHSYSAARFLQSVLGACIPLITYIMAKSIFDNRTALIAGIISSIDPALIMFCGVFFSEILLTLTTMFFTLFLLKENKGPNLKNAVLSGMLLGLSISIRPLFIFMLIFVFLWKFLVTKDHKKSFVFGMTVLVTSLIVMSPWAVRNYIVYKKFVPLTTTTGLALWLSNDPASEGFVRNRSAAPRYVETRTESDGDSYSDILVNNSRDEKEIDDMFLKMFIEKIKKSPAVFINLIPQKLIAFWDGFHFFSYFSPTVMKKKIIARIGYFVIFPFTVIGAVISKNKWRDLLIFYILTINLNIFAVIFYADYRFRLPVMPYFIILSAVAYGRILTRFIDSGGKHEINS